MIMKTETTKELFAVVPQALTANPNINSVEKLIFTYLLGKFQTKTENGRPWTFSGPSIAKGTGLSERTVRRYLKKIRKDGILKRYGWLMSGKKRYEIFIFMPEALNKFISTADKMSAVIVSLDNGVDEIEKNQRTTTADNESAQMSDRNKIVEVRSEKEDDKKEDGTNKIVNPFDEIDLHYKNQVPNPLMKEIKIDKFKPTRKSGGWDELFG